MRTTLRSFLFGATLLAGSAAMAQGHTIYVAGHANPCSPAIAGSTVTIWSYGTISGVATSATAILNANCYYYVEMLVADTTGWVAVEGPCGNGTNTVDTTFYSLTPPFTTDVIVDLNCGNSGSACTACINMTSNSPFAATFSSCTTGGTGAYTYMWDFSGPGGGAVPGNNINRTFQQPGTFAACLNVTDANGVTCQTCETVYVDVNGNVSLDPPSNCQACFNIVPQYNGNTPIPFAANFVNCDPLGSGLSYTWWLPDGSTSTEASTSFTFSGQGIYGVCLTVSDGAGCMSTACDTIVVDPNGGFNTIPVWYDCLGVLWGWNTVGAPCQQGGISGTWNVDCECATSAIPDCEGVPGGTAVPGAPCQQGGIAGTWSATCECIAPTGDCEADFWVIQAHQNGSGPGGEPIPNELWVWNLSSGGTGNYQFLWSFGDGTSSTQPFPTHTYAESGPYVLCLSLTDNSGCTDVHCDTIGIDENGLLQGMIVEQDDHHNTVQSGRSAGFTINVIDPLTMAIPESELSALNLWPNPTQDRLDITLNSFRTGQVRTEVLDATGRRMMATMTTLITGENRLTLDVSGLPAGMYLLRVGEGHRTVVQRFVKAD